MLALIAVGALVVREALAPDTWVSRGEPVFNLEQRPALRRVAAGPGELARWEQRDDGLFVQSVAVAPLRLPEGDGPTSALFPLRAERSLRLLATRHRDLRPSVEGKLRVDEAPGYTATFTARVGTRALFGSVVELVPDDGTREGVVLTLLGTHAAGVHGPDEVGTVGTLKRVLRSVRFGTDPA